MNKPRIYWCSAGLTWVCVEKNSPWRVGLGMEPRNAYDAWARWFP